MLLVQLFTIEQLEALSEKQLHLLRHLVEKEITTDEQLMTRLRERAQAQYNALRPRRARRSS
jgi:hypothetical protein